MVHVLSWIKFKGVRFVSCPKITQFLIRDRIKESVSRLHCIVGEIGIFVAKEGGIGMPSDIWFCASRRDVARAGATQYLNC